MSLALLVDFGSTFTKLTLVDLDRPRLIARRATPTTPDIIDGLQAGLAALERDGFRPDRADVRLACSSAAGGLRVVAIGLVPELTAEASRRAALGAGARVVGVFAGLLQPEDVRRIAGLNPDMILLAGGTDGGNKTALVHNAAALTDGSAEPLPGDNRTPADGRSLAAVPVVVAGNRQAAPDAVERLRAAGYAATATDNVMPRLGVIDVEPARAVMRELFFERIVQAKGLDAAERFVEGVLMPTPAAVLAGARLLAEGTGSIPGWGDVLVVDVGGATTDVHSVGRGDPLEADATRKGLPEPFVKRTVEGDLGVRVSAEAVAEAVGLPCLAARANDALRRQGVPSKGDGDGPIAEDELAAYVRRVADHPASLPQTAREEAMDDALAGAAVETAAVRHAGRAEERATPVGLRRFVTGKDLRNAACVIGTGGVLVHGGVAAGLLKGALYSTERPEVLLPEAPRLYADADYVLSACGLLAQRAPEPALHLLQHHLRLHEMGSLR